MSETGSDSEIDPESNRSANE